MLSEILRKFCYEELIVYRHRILSVGTWTFEFRPESAKNVPQWVSVGFIENQKLDDQVDNISFFLWPLVSSTVFRRGIGRS